MEQAPSLRVAVIGAGPCGLSALVAFSKASARCESDRGCEVVCFEKQSQVGGLWNFTWRTGLDEVRARACHNCNKARLENGLEAACC